MVLLEPRVDEHIPFLYLVGVALVVLQVPLLTRRSEFAAAVVGPPTLRLRRRPGSLPVSEGVPVCRTTDARPGPGPVLRNPGLTEVENK